LRGGILFASETISLCNMNWILKVELYTSLIIYVGSISFDFHIMRHIIIENIEIVFPKIILIGLEYGLKIEFFAL